MSRAHWLSVGSPIAQHAGSKWSSNPRVENFTRYNVDICIRFFGQYIHNYCTITMIYMNSPFGGASSVDGACSSMGSNRRPLIHVHLHVVSASIFVIVLFLWPLLTKTLQPKPRIPHMHHYPSTSTPLYIVQNSGGSMVTTMSGACNSIWLNTGQFTMSRHSKDWLIESSCLILWMMVHGRS